MKNGFIFAVLITFGVFGVHANDSSRLARKCEATINQYGATLLTKESGKVIQITIGYEADVKGFLVYQNKYEKTVLKESRILHMIRVDENCKISRFPAPDKR